METEQMMAHLPAEMSDIRTNEAKADTNLKEVMARLEAMIRTTKKGWKFLALRNDILECHWESIDGRSKIAQLSLRAE
jgi:hypothetical protein